MEKYDVWLLNSSRRYLPQSIELPAILSNADLLYTIEAYTLIQAMRYDELIMDPIKLDDVIEEIMLLSKNRYKCKDSIFVLKVLFASCFGLTIDYFTPLKILKIMVSYYIKIYEMFKDLPGNIMDIEKVLYEPHRNFMSMRMEDVWKHSIYEMLGQIGSILVNVIVYNKNGEKEFKPIVSLPEKDMEFQTRIMKEEDGVAI